ncbi:hypothetical protein B0H13DRAFT_2345219 [Mycena leptocephala]|nr:hypothetical protein B0H13DRAFT_2345219 [Mycena leptocephala]
MSPVQQFAALLTWDILITLDTEVKYLWRRPKSCSCGAFLFFTIGYSVPICNIFIAVFSFVRLSPTVIVSIIMIQRMICTAFRFYQDVILVYPAKPIVPTLDMATAWGILFAFDTIVFALTICNAYFTRIRVGTHAEANMPLYTFIIRDGAFAIALANLANIATFIIGGVSPIG